MKEHQTHQVMQGMQVVHNQQITKSPQQFANTSLSLEAPREKFAFPTFVPHAHNHRLAGCMLSVTPNKGVSDATTH